MIPSLEEMNKLVEIVLESKIYLISDEVYDRLIFDNNRKISFAQYSNLKDRLIIVNGYSKSYAMTGWRLGYVLAPTHITNKINKINQNVMTNTTTFIQKGACSIYLNEENHLNRYLNLLKQRVDLFHEEINKLPHYKGIKPEGGFFYFLDISKTKMKSNEFCSYLIENTGIASTPGLAFGDNWDSYVRFSLATELTTIKKAIELIKDLEIG
jgi:aspartate/methionine/tyrosine aminotransferase